MPVDDCVLELLKLLVGLLDGFLDLLDLVLDVGAGLLNLHDLFVDLHLLLIALFEGSSQSVSFRSSQSIVHLIVGGLLCGSLLLLCGGLRAGNWASGLKSKLFDCGHICLFVYFVLISAA